jgi:hypothetical protein
MRVCVCVCVCVRVCVCVCVHVRRAAKISHVHIHIRIYIFAALYMDVYMYEDMYMDINIYIFGALYMRERESWLRGGLQTQAAKHDIIFFFLYVFAALYTDIICACMYM